MKIVLFILMLNSLAFGQEAQEAPNQETYKVVAIGDAEIETQKISFQKPISDKINEREKVELQTYHRILESDFSLYKHLFTVANYKDSTKAQFRLHQGIEKKGLEFFINLKLEDTISKKTIYIKQKKIWFNNIISFAHTVSDEVYQAITGQKSIFKTKILFVSDRTSVKKDLRKELYLMDFDGRRKQRLTYLNSMVISPSLSPDNTKAVFSVIGSKWKKRSRGGVHKVKNINLVELNLRTRKQKEISTLDGINSGAVYDTSGKNIYLTLSSLKNADIYKMNLATKGLTRVTSHFSDDVDPNINEDGSLITFLSGRAGKAMIYTANPKGTEKSVKRISYVGKFNAAPRFSPDGSEIVFSSWVDNLFDLYRIGSDGRNLVRLTKNFGSNEEAWYSPDGQFIVFTSQTVLSKTKAVQNIYIMNREGEILKQLTENYGKCYTPRWSN